MAGRAPANHSASSSKVSGSDSMNAMTAASSSGVRGLSPGLSLGIFPPFLVAGYSQTYYPASAIAFGEYYHVQPFADVTDCQPPQFLVSVCPPNYGRIPIEILDLRKGELTFRNIGAAFFLVPLVLHY